MVDKTDSDSLLSILSRLLLEHQAMRVILEADGPSWKLPAIRHCARLRVRQQLQGRLRELSDALQYRQPDDNVLPLLTKVLEGSLALQGVLPL